MALFGSIVFIGMLSAVFGYEDSFDLFFPKPPSTNDSDIIIEGYNFEDEVEPECNCKPYYNCETFESSADGGEYINIRVSLGQCESYLDVCCKNQTSTENSISSSTQFNYINDTDIHYAQTSSPNEHTSSPMIEHTVSNGSASTVNIEITQKLDTIKSGISSVVNHLTDLFSPKNYSASTESAEIIKSHQNPSSQNSSETPDELVGLTESPIFPQAPEEETVVSTIHSKPVHKCGIWNKQGVGFRIFNDIDGESEYSEYPSMVAIFEEDLKNPVDKLVLKCGGSLIKPNVILTAAHCVIKTDYSKIIIRAGDWDLKTEKELYPTQEMRASKIVTHKEYYSGGLHNDIALIFTEKNFTLDENVQLMCLPEEKEIFTGTRCFSTGWGKTVSFNNYSIIKKTESGNIHQSGQYEVCILKKVELPIVSRDQCQQALKSTRLGPKFILDDSFLCAGGEKGKDTCKGDGGSPLMCPLKDDHNRLVQVGIVSWGIECGLENIPGVYTDVPCFRKWIDHEIENYGVPV